MGKIWPPALAVAAAILWGWVFWAPYFAGALNATRLYHIALFFLAPLCVTGVTFFSKLWTRKLRASSTPVHVRRGAQRAPTIAVGLLLVGYFLFTSGFVFQVTGDVP